MDRRTLFTTLLKRQQEETPMPMSPPTGGLTTYTGPWKSEQVTHLLRRAMFGPNQEQINWAIEKGLVATIDKLFEDLPLPEPPVNPDYKDDTKVPIGATWVNAPYNAARTGDEIGYRFLSLSSWTFGLILNEGISIREKLTLFWHNHLPINSVIDPKYLYRYGTILRSYALGNFRNLIKSITVDPSMLMFLNGNQNTKVAPNENYARELLELFTIGKGPLVAPGDYTNYTEQDVKEIARILSGWEDYGYGTTIPNSSGEIGTVYSDASHDKNIKKLSHRFDGQEVSDRGAQEYKYLIDIIFKKSETARFICRRLYKWFVFHEITPEVESTVIQPMAQILITSNYEIKPALKALLQSEHFFEEKFRGAIIKNPIELIMSIYKPLKIKISEDLKIKYFSWYHLFKMSTLMQMEYYNIPEVAGWRAYYVAPGYYRNWINASTLPIRNEFGTVAVTSGQYAYQAVGAPMQPDVLSLLNALNDPYNPTAVVEEFTNLLLPWPPAESQKMILKDYLLGGLPDFEWGVEYTNYRENPQNSQLASALTTKLKALLKAIVEMAAFQLG